MRTVITRPLAGELLEQLEDLRHVDTNHRRGDKPHGHRSHPTDAPWRVLCRMPGPVAAPIPQNTIPTRTTPSARPILRNGSRFQ